MPQENIVAVIFMTTYVIGHAIIFLPGGFFYGVVLVRI